MRKLQDYDALLTEQAVVEVQYLCRLRTGGLMLYLLPSCGAAGVFLGGAGLGGSPISSPK